MHQSDEVSPVPQEELSVPGEGKTMEGSDIGYASAKWEFDEEVTRVIDDMLERSIPQYEVMRRAVFDVACRYVKPHTDIVDLGCSRGEAMAPLVDRFGAHNRFVGIEVSPSIRRMCRRPGQTSHRRSACSGGPLKRPWRRVCKALWRGIKQTAIGQGRYR